MALETNNGMYSQFNVFEEANASIFFISGQRTVNSGQRTVNSGQSTVNSGYSKKVYCKI
jgi:hypothetical protein